MDPPELLCSYCRKVCRRRVDHSRHERACARAFSHGDTSPHAAQSLQPGSRDHQPVLIDDPNPLIVENDDDDELLSDSSDSDSSSDSEISLDAEVEADPDDETPLESLGFLTVWKRTENLLMQIQF